MIHSQDNRTYPIKTHKINCFSLKSNIQNLSIKQHNDLDIYKPNIRHSPETKYHYNIFKVKVPDVLETPRFGSNLHNKKPSFKNSNEQLIRTPIKNQFEKLIKGIHDNDNHFDEKELFNYNEDVDLLDNLSVHPILNRRKNRTMITKSSLRKFTSSCVQYKMRRNIHSSSKDHILPSISNEDTVLIDYKIKRRLFEDIRLDRTKTLSDKNLLLKIQKDSKVILTPKIFERVKTHDYNREYSPNVESKEGKN